MARLARVVVPGHPHHVTQRGNRRQPTFFSDADRQLYLELLLDSCQMARVEIWAYCLMPNHVHLIVVPETPDGLKLGIGITHQRYTRAINRKMDWRGYLWQGRFSSFPMNERYLLAAARYVEMNPVRAGLVLCPGEYRWSSAAFHLGLRGDPVVMGSPFKDMVPDWKCFLSSCEESEQENEFKQAGR